MQCVEQMRQLYMVISASSESRRQFRDRIFIRIWTLNEPSVVIINKNREQASQSCCWCGGHTLDLQHTGVVGLHSAGRGGGLMYCLRGLYLFLKY